MKDKIDADLKTAMIAGEKEKVETLKMLKSALQMAAIEEKGELSDDQAVKVLQKQAKQRQESAEMFDKGGNAEQAAKERAELELINEYLPEQMSETEIEAIVDKIIASGADNMGAVMGQAMQKCGGQADGGTVSRIVKEKLG